MATYSSVLAWRTPGTGEPGGLPSMGLHRVGHDWSDLAKVQNHHLSIFKSPILKSFCFITKLFQFTLIPKLYRSMSWKYCLHSVKNPHFLRPHFSIYCCLALIFISFPQLSLRWSIASVLLNPAEISYSLLTVSEPFYLSLHFSHLETLFTQSFHDVQLLVFLPPLRPLRSVSFTDSYSSSSSLYPRLLFSFWAMSQLQLQSILYA